MAFRIKIFELKSGCPTGLPQAALVLQPPYLLDSWGEENASSPIFRINIFISEP